MFCTAVSVRESPRDMAYDADAVVEDGALGRQEGGERGVCPCCRAQASEEADEGLDIAGDGVSDPQVLVPVDGGGGQCVGGLGDGVE